MTVFLATAAADNASLAGVAGDTVSFVNAPVANVISLTPFITQTGWAAGDQYGAAVNNFILGNFGDFFAGDGRNLTVTGGLSNDSIRLFIGLGATGTGFGGGGDDLFISGPGHETFDGGANSIEGDAVGFNASAAGVTASLGDQSINTGDAAGDVYINIENLQGSIFGDTLYSVADGREHQLIGDPGIGDGIGGNDTLYGAVGANAGYTNFIPGAGQDVVNLGDGGNQLDYETAAAGLTVSLVNMALSTGDAAGDILVGAAGKNIDIAGSPFADTLTGDDGNNNILGDPYNDFIYASQGGNDRIFGLGGDDNLTGGPGADTLDGGSGFNLAAYSQARTAVVADLGTPGNNTGEAAGDVYINIQGFFGSIFSDTLRGDGGDNRIFGLAGNDQIFGGGGDDLLIGGAGADAFDGGSGYDTVYYGEAGLGLIIDMVTPGNSTGDAAGDSFVLNTIEGVTGTNFDDLIQGDSGSTFFNGGTGRDTIHGGAGNDGIAGGAGADTLYGDAGADNFKYFAASESSGANIDTIVDFAATVDAVDLTSIPPANVVLTRTVAGGTTLTADISGTPFQINLLTNIAGLDVRGLTAGVTINGSALGEVLIGSALADTLFGAAGADTLTGAGGTDVFRYTAASESTAAAPDLIIDFLLGVNKLDFSTLGASGFVFTHPAGRYEISASTPGGTIVVDSTRQLEVTDILGQSGAISYTGDASGETFRGTQFNDTLQGGGGADAIFGLGGADTFLYSSASDSNPAAQDTLQDFQTGIDRIDLSAIGLSNTAQQVSLQRGGGPTYLFAATGGGTFSLAALADINGDDLTGLTRGIFIVGDAGANTLRGTGSTDLFDGNGGADTITGGAGADVFRYFAAGDSTPAARDVITDFSTGSDSFDFGGLAASAMTLTRGVGSTSITGTAAGGAFAIDVTGLVNGTDLVGVPSGITLIGNAGGEALVGTGSSDILIGGDGQDTLTGGGGVDVFRFTAQSHSPQSAPDLITDLQSGIESIDLTGMGATLVALTRVAGNVTQLTGTTAQGTFQVNIAGVAVGSDLAGLTSGIVTTGDGAVENLRGTAFADTLVGGGGGDILYGLGGADVFRYNSTADSNPSGQDTIQDFQTGLDRIDISAIGLSGTGPQQVSLQHSGGATFLFGATTGGTFSLGSLTDFNGDDLIGLSRGVYIVGDAPGEVLRGTPSTDLIDGNGGADTITGGDGADVFRLFTAADSTAAAPDMVLDFQAGVDQFSIGSLAPSAVSIARAGGGTTITIQGGGGGTVIRTMTAVNTDDFTGYSGNVTVTGDGLFGGTAFNDSLVGGAADETFNGGGGHDTMAGGGGNDQYLIDDAGDVIIEAAGAGVDTVYVTFSGYAMAANVEVGRLFGVNALSLTGNAGDNTLVGNDFGLASTMAGGDGNDVFYSSASADNLDGGNGNDIFYTGGGADTVLGGQGNDQAVIYDSGVIFTEAANAGIDTAWVGVASYVLGPNIEIGRLFGAGQMLSGSSSSEDLVANVGASVLNGNGGDDVLWGQAGNDTLNGGGGDDIFRTGGGADLCTGGTGNDSYVFTSVAAQAIEAAGEGYDIVYQGAAGTFAIGENIEEARLFGAGNSLIGNALANLLVGNNTGLGSTVDGGAGNDIIYGSAGNDLISGGAGDDELRGLAGADIFAFAGNWGYDQVVDFSSAEGDKIAIQGASFAQLGIVSGGNTEVTFGGNTIYLFNVSSLQASDFIFS